MSELIFSLKIIDILSRLASRLRYFILNPEKYHTEIRAILSTMQNLDQLHTGKYYLATTKQLSFLAEMIEPVGINELVELKQVINEYSLSIR